MNLSRAVLTVCLSVLILATIDAGSLSAQEPGGPDLSSPRETFRSFLEAMVEVKRGDASRIEDAVACLDLSSTPASMRLEIGRKHARDLKNYLDKVEWIDVDRQIPAEVDGKRWTYRRVRAGEVSLVRAEDGRWLFSSETLESLDSLLDSVRGKEFVAGIEGGGGARLTLADWLRDRAPESLRGRFFLLEGWQWIALFVLAFAGVVLDRIVRMVLRFWLRRLLARSEKLRERSLDTDFLRPIGILFMALLWSVLLPVLDLPVLALTTLRFATKLLMAAGGVWAAYRLVDLLAAHFEALAKRTDSRIDDLLVPMVRRALKIVVVAFGLLFIAQNLDIDVTSILAGLGIGGIALALAAKDTVENLFGSLTVLIDRPFQIGDWVVIGDQEGTVEELGFRSTRIRTFYNSLITMPNSRLVNTAVDNLGARRYRRVKCMISIQYDTPPDRIEAFCEGVRELIRKHPYTRKDYYMVYFNEFADSSLNVLLYAFHQTPDWPTELRERHRLFVDIVRLAHRLGVEFAFPTRTLHLASAPPGMTVPPSPVSGTGDAASPPATAGSHEDAIRLGRAEAEAIMEEMWAGEEQAPVDFRDPDRLRTG